MAKAKTVTKNFVKPTVKSFDTIIRPVITEKTMALMQNQNKVTVEVAKNANRAAVKIAFEAIFNVKVENVNIVNTLIQFLLSLYAKQLTIIHKSLIIKRE